MDDSFFQNIKMLDNGKINSLISMRDAINVMDQAFMSFSNGSTKVPHRSITYIKNLDLFFKPAYNESLGRVAIKIITQKKDGNLNGVPAILGVVLLLDMNTGAVLSMMDGTHITSLRTGAAGGIATELLSRKDASTVAIFGCGVQGKTLLEATCAVRPIVNALLYDLDIEAANKVKLEMGKKLNISIQVEKGLENLSQADIICTATNSKNPLFRLNDISQGVHINAIGSYKPDMQEIDPQIINNGKLFVDSREAVLKESGDLIKPIVDRIFTKEVIKAEIGELSNNINNGRTSDDEITIFKSVGLGVQDLYIANAIFEKHSKL